MIRAERLSCIRITLDRNADLVAPGANEAC
jgi:hypothetical protein